MQVELSQYDIKNLIAGYRYSVTDAIGDARKALQKSYFQGASITGDESVDIPLRAAAVLTETKAIIDKAVEGAARIRFFSDMLERSAK